MKILLMLESRQTLKVLAKRKRNSKGQTKYNRITLWQNRCFKSTLIKENKDQMFRISNNYLFRLFMKLKTIKLAN